MAKELINGRVECKEKVWFEQQARMLKTTESWVLRYLIHQAAGDSLEPLEIENRPFKDWNKQ